MPLALGLGLVLYSDVCRELSSDNRMVIAWYAFAIKPFLNLTKWLV